MAYGKSQSELWQMAFNNTKQVSVNITNIPAINKIIKPCYVKLLEIETNSNTTQQEQASQHDTPGESLGSITVNENRGYKIVGLDNKANFCYLNSIIQVLVCILLHSGCTYDHLVSNQRFFSNALFNYKTKGYQLHNRKRNLQIIRSWFSKGKNAIPLLNGSLQQDVHEAFVRIMNILHDGTKYCTIPDLPPNLIEDSMYTSFPRFLFRFLVEKTSSCKKCNKQSISEEYFEEISIKIQSHNSINKMINEYWHTKLQKFCSSCKEDTNHIMNTKITHHPRILMIILARFDNTLQKVNLPIAIDTSITIFGREFSLMSIINHHGNSQKSGHYTATLKYNSWWTADDHRIQPFSLSCLANSTTSYLVFYKQ